MAQGHACVILFIEPTRIQRHDHTCISNHSTLKLLHACVHTLNNAYLITLIDNNY